MKDDIDVRHRRKDENQVAIRRMAWGGLAAFVAVVAIGVAVNDGDMKPQRLVDYAISDPQTDSDDAAPTMQDVFLAAGAAGTADPQQTLMKYCLQRNSTLRAQGIIQHGGARPGVMPETWATLSPSAQSEIIQLAGCIQAGGKPGQIEGVVVEAGLPKVALARKPVLVAYR
jgi:hypothetical protein